MNLELWPAALSRIFLKWYKTSLICSFSEIKPKADRDIACFNEVVYCHLLVKFARISAQFSWNEVLKLKNIYTKGNIRTRIYNKGFVE